MVLIPCVRREKGKRRLRLKDLGLSLGRLEFVSDKVIPRERANKEMS